MIKMSSILKYLEKYEDNGEEVIFHLKDLPSVKSAGNKYVRELYIHLFNDQSLQLNRVQKIDDLTYRVQKEQESYCLNCKSPIFFDDDSTCDFCNWRNDLVDNLAPDFSPIAIRREGAQVAYPLIELKDLEYLPERLKDSIIAFFDDNLEFDLDMRRNIYHNLYKKDENDLRMWKDIARKYEQKIKLSQFFKKTNLFKSKEDDLDE